MNKSNDKLIKKSNNNINFLIKLKCEVNIHKISYISDRYFQYSPYRTSGLEYHIKYKRIITKKLKHFKIFDFIPIILKNKINNHIKNLEIDHLKLDFDFDYFSTIYGISPIMQLATLIHLLKFMNIKNLILCIAISKRYCPTYDQSCKSLRNILQKYCKNMHVTIDQSMSTSCFITKLGAGVNIINEHYATINKFKVNHHRNYQLKYRTN